MSDTSGKDLELHAIGLHKQHAVERRTGEQLPKAGL